jgi:hypothetical protein
MIRIKKKIKYIYIVLLLKELYVIYDRLRSASRVISASTPQASILSKLKYICKTQINIQSLNPCPISTTQISVPQIYVLFSNSEIYGSFSLQCPMTYALTLTNKSAIDRRIWKGCIYILFWGLPQIWIR